MLPIYRVRAAYTCTRANGSTALGNSTGACYGLGPRKLKQVEKSRRQHLTGAKWYGINVTQRLRVGWGREYVCLRDSHIRTHARDVKVPRVLANLGGTY